MAIHFFQEWLIFWLNYGLKNDGKLVKLFDNLVLNPDRILIISIKTLALKHQRFSLWLSLIHLKVNFQELFTIIRLIQEKRQKTEYSFFKSWDFHMWGIVKVSFQPVQSAKLIFSNTSRGYFEKTVERQQTLS